MGPQSRRERDKSGYLAQDTVAAIATAVEGAVSVVRLSGPEAFRVLTKIAPDLVETEARKMKLTVLKDVDGDVLDHAMVVRFVSPKSFTGEDCVELHLHGGALIATRVMETLFSFGVRQALPGEFSFRAVRNGKINLSQAEAIADLIGATNEGAQSLALEKLSGSQAALFTNLADGLRRLTALGELGIDFSDQDVDELKLDRLKTDLSQWTTVLRTLKAGFSRGSKIQEGVRVVFVGLPNAGKSSFFNALLGEDRSIVSEFAGTTRDVVAERIRLKSERSSVTLRLEDTAGLRIGTDPVEKIGIERSQKAVEKAELILFVLDPTSDLEEVKKQWEQLGQPSERTLGIVSKRDLMSEQRQKEIVQSLGFFSVSHWFLISAVTGEGIEKAVEGIVEFCRVWTKRSPGEVLLTRLDHLQAVEESLGHLERAHIAPEYELFAADVRHALHALAPLIGTTLTDDILGQIFSEFCIGK